MLLRIFGLKHLSMFHKLVLFCVVLLIFNSSCSNTKSEYPLRMDLSEGWEFSDFQKDSWLKATVPGCVHLDLYNNQMIPHPYSGNNENALQWISSHNWEYQKSFFLDESSLSRNMEIVFEGLDTHANVYLNDSLIFKADNMFRQWRIRVNSFAHPGENVLRILFKPAHIYDSITASTSAYKLPDKRGFSRKAPYQYGWDWGPRLVGCGIWRPVYLEIFDDWKIENIRVQSSLLPSGDAMVIFDVSTHSVTTLEVSLNLEISDLNIHLQKNLKLSDGFQQHRLEISIEKPRLWWPNGMGEANLYQSIIEVSDKSHRQRIITEFGICDIRLINKPDSIGESFYFLVNDKAVFVKGANYIPSDFFSHDLYKIRQNLVSAKLAGMNMLRVWGGAYYEQDEFYRLADSLGIMIWQDFMFACNMYPGDEAFLKNVRQEAIENVKRIRNHPCIALWCGNNEVDEGWKNWGWQKQLSYTKGEEKLIERAYDDIFNNILPGVIKDLDSKRSYWSSSPSIGWGHPESLKSGDSHYWGVWWGEQAFEVYNQKVGRFMSEYGFQGFPVYDFLGSFDSAKPLDLSSTSFKNHQKHSRGFELIRKYMESDFDVPAKNQDYVFVSGILQAEGMRIALEAHRRAMPYCMGTLYWQLNDCWPVISWSSIDYAGNWKPFHYQAKRSFKPTLLSVENPYNSPVVYLIRDDENALEASLELKLIDFNGNLIESHIIGITHKGFGSEKITNNLHTYFRNKIKSNDSFVKMILKKGDKQICSSVTFFARPKELNLSKSEIHSSFKIVGDSCIINLSSHKLIRFVGLSITNASLIFSDNYFDLIPNETRYISFAHQGMKLDEIRRDLKINHLNQIVNP